MLASPIHSSLRTLSVAVLAWMAFAAITVAAAVLTQRAPDVAQAGHGTPTKAALVTYVGPRQSPVPGEFLLKRRFASGKSPRQCCRH